MSDDIAKLLLPEVSYRYLVADHPLQVMELDPAGKILFANRFEANLTNPWGLGDNLIQKLEGNERLNAAKAVKSVLMGAGQASCEITVSYRDGGGMRFLLQLGAMTEGNRILSVLSPIQTTRARKPDDIVEPTQIRSLLLTALLANETIDVHMDEQDETFNSLLLPFPPQNDGKSPSDFLPGGYLASMNHLLLGPLEPSSGNIRIRKARDIRLTFNGEESAFRGPVQFHAILQGKDGHALKTSFPHVLEPFRRRESKRVRVPMGMAIKVLIKPDNSQTMETLLGDISANGLSFFYPATFNPLPNNTEINLVLNVGSGRFLEIFGVVCNTHVARDSGNPYAMRKKAGVEFYPLANPEDQDKLEKFIDKLEKNFRFFLENKQRKYDFSTLTP